MYLPESVVYIFCAHLMVGQLEKIKETVLANCSLCKKFCISCGCISEIYIIIWWSVSDKHLFYDGNAHDIKYHIISKSASFVWKRFYELGCIQINLIKCLYVYVNGGQVWIKY